MGEYKGLTAAGVKRVLKSILTKKRKSKAFDACLSLRCEFAGHAELRRQGLLAYGGVQSCT